MIKNKYQIYKMSGNYTGEEIKSIEGRTFCWNARQVPSEQDKPIDPESSAIPAIFQSQRRVASERARKQKEDEKNMPKTHDEHEYLRKKQEEMQTHYHDFGRGR